jgi:hypothetical protein
MAGANDAIAGDIDPQKEEQLWEGIVADPLVIVTLVSPSRSASLNLKIDLLNHIAFVAAERHHRPVISLDILRGDDGLIRPEYTVDGIHLTPPAYKLWKAKLKELGA